MGIIYCYRNLVNKKCYIGQTVNKEQRYKQHKSSAFNIKDREYNSIIHRAFRKYGLENFEYTILAETDDVDALNLLEIFFIEKMNSKVPNGYNIEDGGKNSLKPHSEETKQKLMKAHAVLTEQEVIELRIAYRNNQSPSKIYKEKYFDKMTYQSFYNIWTGKRYSSIMPEVIQNGRHTKLNKETVKAIRKEREDFNLSYTELAEKYSVSKSTISDIIKKRTWKDV